MCPPGLHITLGIFLRLFVLLESECHQLDLLLLPTGIPGADSGLSYDRACAALKQIDLLKDEQKSLQDGLLLLQQLLTLLATTAVNTTDPRFVELTMEIAKTKKQLKNKVSFVTNINTWFKAYF